MAAACVKYDDGSRHYVTNGFPPRKKFSTKSKDAGLYGTTSALRKTGKRG